MLRATVAAILSSLAAGCGTVPAPVTVEAECKLLKAPPAVVRTDRRDTQIWADQMTSTAHRSCGHPLPPDLPPER